MLVDGDNLQVTQAIALAPETRPLTWLFQVMPVFFAVGGYVNRGSWDRAREHGHTAATWIRDRSRRLLAPTVPVLALWTLVVSAGPAAGVETDLIVEAARGALLPLWFLAVYVAVVALTPLSVRIHERLGARVLVPVTVGIAACDVATRAGLELVGSLTYLLVWGGAHQLGYLWADHRPRSSRAVSAGLAAWLVAAGLVVVGGYPGSMVAVDGATLQNTDPPSLALWAFSLGQLAFLAAAYPALRRWIEHDTRYGAVAAGGGSILTIFLWHMTAVVIVAATLVPTGVWPPAEGPGVDATWWAWRPVWVAACALVLAGLWAVAHRAERVEKLSHQANGWRVTLGVVATVAGLAAVMVGGLADDDGQLALLPVGVIALGVWALQVVHRRPEATQTRS